MMRFKAWLIRIKPFTAKKTQTADNGDNSPDVCHAQPKKTKNKKHLCIV